MLVECDPIQDSRIERAMQCKCQPNAQCHRHGKSIEMTLPSPVLRPNDFGRNTGLKLSPQDTLCGSNMLLQRETQSVAS